MTTELAAWTRALYAAWRAEGVAPSLPPSLVPGVAALRLTPLAYRVLAGGGVSPPDRLTTDYRNALSRNLVRLHALRQDLDVLVSEGIGATLMKGAAFLVCYGDGDLGLRALADVDLLVAPGALEATLEVLRSRGYEGITGETYREDHHAIYMGRRQGPVDLHLDIHRSLGPLRGHKRLARTLHRTATQVGGYRVPAPVPWLWAIAVHRMNGGFMGDARELFDFARVLETVDPTAVLALASATDARTAMVITAQHVAYWTGSRRATALARMLAPALQRRTLQHAFPAAPSHPWRGTSAFRHGVAMPVGSGAPLRALTHAVRHGAVAAQQVLRSRYKGLAGAAEIL